MTAPEKRADTRQQGVSRAAWHTLVDHIHDHYPNIAENARHRGYPTNLRGEHSGSSDYTTVEAAVIDNRPERLGGGGIKTDVNAKWLASYLHVQKLIYTLDGQANILDPPKAKRLGRENNVEPCALCDQPITGATKRKDGNPYHAGPAGQPWCWYTINRTQQCAGTDMPAEQAAQP